MKQWLRRTLICLLLGAVTTVAVAGACTELGGYTTFHQWWRSPTTGLIEPAPNAASHPLPSPSRYEERIGWLEENFRGYSPRPGNELRSATYIGMCAGPLLDEMIVMGWGWERANPRHRGTDISHDLFLATQVVRVGWPFRAIRSTRRFDDRDEQDQMFSIRVMLLTSRRAEDGYTRSPDSEYGQPARMPLESYRPIWLGLLLNIVIYSALWFLATGGVRASKRTIRRRRGRCPMCGYDLRYHHAPRGASRRPHDTHHSESGGTSAGCPECGWGREPTTESPHP